MWENAYLSIKNPKASRALKWALDPGRKLLASLRQQLSASAPGAPPPLDQILDPHLILFYEHNTPLEIVKLFSCLIHTEMVFCKKNTFAVTTCLKFFPHSHKKTLIP